MVSYSGRNRKNYRDQLEIIESILNKAGNGCKKTHIMYGANLSTTQLKRYLDMLIKIECIVHDGEDQLYKVTAKGKDLLATITEVARAKVDLRRSQERLEVFIGVRTSSEDASDYFYTLSRSNRLLSTPKYSI